MNSASALNTTSSSVPNTDNLKRNTANIIQLFKHWDLTIEEQCLLLGGISPQQLNKFKNAKAHVSGIDSIERVGNLLGIHKSLRILYPYNRTAVYKWIKAKNTKLHNFTPLEIMLSKNYLGIAQIRKLTDYMRGI